MTYVQKTYEVQKTYDALNEIANNEPFKFIREWNKWLVYSSPLFIRKMEEFDDTIYAFGLSPIQVFRIDYNDFEEIDRYFVFDGYRMVSADKISELLDWLIYNYDRAVYRWVYNVAFPEFSVTNDEKSFYNQLNVKGE